MADDGTVGGYGEGFARKMAGAHGLAAGEHAAASSRRLDVLDGLASVVDADPAVGGAMDLAARFDATAANVRAMLDAEGPEWAGAEEARSLISDAEAAADDLRRAGARPLHLDDDEGA